MPPHPQPIPRKKRTVEVDERFKAMFSDKRFGSDVAVDPRGRRKAGGSKSMQDDLKVCLPPPRALRACTWAHRSGQSLYHLEGEEEEGRVPEEEVVDPRFAVDYSRGEVLMESSESEEDEDEDEDEDEAAAADVYPGGLPDTHERVELAEAQSRRLAVCNVDWSKITAGDLFVLANSFKPATGSVIRATVYPSEFGLARMAVEETQGPGVFITGPGAKEEGSEEEEEELEELELDRTVEVDQAKVRQYELAKLRYYYAIIECDSAATAAVIYDACDGMEFEKSQNVLDLRFVPDGVEFDAEPRDTATEPPPHYDFDPNKLEQATLAHSKLKVSWDEEEQERRVVLTKRDFKPSELENLDYEAYLASDTEGSDESEDEDRAQRTAALKALAAEAEAEAEAEEPDQGMEVTWNVGLKEKAETMLREREARKSEAGLTAWELLEKKRKEKKKAARLERKRRREGEGEGEPDSDADDLAHLRAGGNDDFFQLDPGPEFGPREGVTQQPKAAPDTKAKEGKGKKGKKGARAEEDADDGDGHFDMTTIVKAHKLGKRGKHAKRRAAALGPAAQGGDFELDMSDPRFGAVFSNKDFSIDPTQPDFRGTAQMDKLIEERQRRVKKQRGGTDTEQAPPPKGGVQDMVANIKRSKGKRRK